MALQNLSLVVNVSVIIRRFLQVLKAIVAASSILAASSAFAADRNQTKAMQHALFRMGLYEAEIDGLSGPGTRGAMSEYSKKFGVENKFYEIALDIEYRRRSDWQGDWSEEHEKAVSEEMETYLLDFDSAKIKEKLLFIGDDGWETVCLFLNAKNQMGAYTGYRWLFVPVMHSKNTSLDMPPFVAPDLIPPLPKETHEFWCQMGFIIGQNVD
jgi:hypothetical protein